MSETMLDNLASEARTALDDPEYYDIRDQAQAQALAISKLDEIINLLNPADETREAYAATLEILGRHLAERQDVIEANELNYEEHDAETKTAYETAHDAVGRALDALDEAIAALRPEQS